MGAKMGILGKKVGMTQIFTDEGLRHHVTVVEAGPCVVLAKQTPEQNGYAALRLGFDEQKPHRVNRPDMGNFAKANTTPKRFIQEIRISADELSKFEVGQEISLADVFKEGDWIDVTGTSKGKGFQGVIKRHHYSGANASHGAHESFRHGGSIGCRLTPGRTVKGRPMPGQMGNKQVTVQNLRVVGVRPDDNLLLVRGAIPGAPHGYVVVRHAVKKAVKAA
ncbi:MAG: 50S ribosomal protein L3 [Deltaproteobacteria bacterium]|nr:50S ribosomal protein L3 [Deltaproteobacteria bacterium]